MSSLKNVFSNPLAIFQGIFFFFFFLWLSCKCSRHLPGIWFADIFSHFIYCLSVSCNVLLRRKFLILIKSGLSVFSIGAPAFGL